MNLQDLAPFLFCLMLSISINCWVKKKTLKAHLTCQRFKLGTWAAHKPIRPTSHLHKRLPCSNASRMHPASVETYCQFKSPRRRANIQHGYCQNAGWRKPCFNFCNSAGRHIQLDLIYLAMCISSSFLSLLSSSQPGRTEFYFLHFGNTCSLAAISL